MKKVILFVSIVVLFVVCGFVMECVVEKKQLQENIIRLHVIANSDSTEDQAQKLRVRDRVLAYLAPILADVTDFADAEEHIRESIPQLERTVCDLLQEEGADISVRVSLTDSAFDTRYYDTFALPAGVYSSLRVELGEAEGKNWWCVAFPSLCIPAAGKDFSDVAAGAGFSDNLTGSLSGKNRFEVRFFVIDLLGRLENLFFKR